MVLTEVYRHVNGGKQGETAFILRLANFSTAVVVKCSRSFDDYKELYLGGVYIERQVLTLWTPESGIPAARYISAIARSRYTGGTVINATGQRPVYRRHGSQLPRPEAGIPDLFSNAYWHRNARVIEIQTRQQLKNNYFHETQRICMNKFCIWTPGGQRTS